MAELTLGSLFDGLGGWQLAALHNGVRPVWSSEIETFPMAVTKKHFPDTLQLGDINRLNGAEIPPVDIICAGSPCQDLSVAGKRKGLDGERSGLFRKAIDIVSGMRTATNGEYPKFFIWENVPGAFSSNKGADFQAVLEEITKSKIPMPAGGKWAAAGMVRSGRCDIAWRVLDAQYWGVPQRRKRIFLVSDFRDKKYRNTAVLFEPESVPGNPAPGGNEGQGTAAGAENNIGTTSSFEPGITAREDSKHGSVAVIEKPQAYSFDSLASNSMKSSNPHSGCRAVDVAKTLDTSDQNPAKNQGGIAVVCPVVSMGHDERSAGFIPGIADPLTASDYKQPPVVACIGNGQCNQLSLQDKMGALNCMHDQQAIITAREHKSMIQEAVYAIDRAAFNQGKNAKYNFSIDRGGKAQTIVAKGPGAVMVKN